MSDEQLDLEGGAHLVFPDTPIRGGADAEQPYSLSPRAKRPSQNPLVRVFGPGPEGTTCRDCVHLWRHDQGHAGRYLKCDLRRFTHGPGSDHRAGWRSCGRYEREKPLDSDEAEAHTDGARPGKAADTGDDR